MIEIDIEKENKAIAQEYKELLRISYQTLTPADKKLIRKAFDVAVDAHKEQRRKSVRRISFILLQLQKLLPQKLVWERPLSLRLYYTMLSKTLL
jgi:guanosine-3',5'-bis(diphosphate) 3'-pyrophosphohydrolase